MKLIVSPKCLMSVDVHQCCLASYVNPGLRGLRVKNKFVLTFLPSRTTSSTAETLDPLRVADGIHHLSEHEGHVLSSFSHVSGSRRIPESGVSFCTSETGKRYYVGTDWYFLDPAHRVVTRPLSPGTHSLVEVHRVATRPLSPVRHSLVEAH